MVVLKMPASLITCGESTSLNRASPAAASRLMSTQTSHQPRPATHWNWRACVHTRADCHSSLSFFATIGIIHTNENMGVIMTEDPRLSWPAAPSTSSRARPAHSSRARPRCPPARSAAGRRSMLNMFTAAEGHYNKRPYTPVCSKLLTREPRSVRKVARELSMAWCPPPRARAAGRTCTPYSSSSTPSRIAMETARACGRRKTPGRL